MKITVLSENTCKSGRLGAEHGLSLYIEVGKKRVLFDMGQGSLFAENARLLGIDLSLVDFAVLSHGHYDHGGGLGCFLKINSNAKVYISPNAFGNYYNAMGKYIGLDKELLHSPRLLMPRAEDVFIDENFSLVSLNRAINPDEIDSAGLTVDHEGEKQPDKFLHEQYLIIEEEGKRVVISGCSHKGAVNIARLLKPTAFVGGFHFSKLETAGAGAERLTDSAEKLLGLCNSYYTCHCTGTEQYGFMKALMKDSLSYISTGDVIEL